MATFAPDSASFRAIPRPIPREPPVTSAYFPLSVIKHLLAQILWRILGLGKVHVNPRGRDTCIAERRDCGVNELLLQRIQFDVAEEHFSAFGLEQDSPTGGKCFGAFVG